MGHGVASLLRLGALCCALWGGASTEKPSNVIFILTDDQSAKLDSLEHMPKLARHLGDGGVEVVNGFAATPVCCPSRSSIYTGRYIHNTRVFNNSAGPGGCSSLQWQHGAEKNTVATFMHDLGYATAFLGKYLNNYGVGDEAIHDIPECLNVTLARNTTLMYSNCAQKVEHVPPGWSYWQGLVGNSVYYNYTLSNNGTSEDHGDDYASDYLTDLIKNRSMGFMEENLRKDQPFFLLASVPAAHEPADPAPQYYNYADGVIAPRTPNFNVLKNDDGRHWMISHANVVGVEMNDTMISFVDLLYRRRISTLQSVDDLIDEFMHLLRLHNAVDDTYIIYTADNGYHLGQFAIPFDKRQNYETDVRLPFFARGPGIPHGVSIDSGAFVTVDIAPTILEFAGMSTQDIAALGLDGQPMGWLLRNEEPPYESRTFLVEFNGEGIDNCIDYLENDYTGLFLDQLTDGMNCQTRGPDSYVTPPYWEGKETWSAMQDAHNNTYGCAVTLNSSVYFKYCEWDSGEVEFYDVKTDEWEMTNLAMTMPEEEKAAYSRALGKLKRCRGAECDEISVW